MKKSINKFFKTGDVFIWFSGFGLALTLIMISGLLLLIMLKGSDYYLVDDVALIHMKNGEKYLGEIKAEELISHMPDSLSDSEKIRYQLKIGNRELYGLDFKWVNNAEIDSITYPTDAVSFERSESGNFYGFILGLKVKDKFIDKSSDIFPKYFNQYFDESRILNDKVKSIEKEIGSINYELKSLNNKLISLKNNNSLQEEISSLKVEIENLQEEYLEIENSLLTMHREQDENKLVVQTVGSIKKEISLNDIVRYYYPNQLSAYDKIILAKSKIIEFIFDEPRESNTEGGVFPAIFGTVMMVVLMSLFAVPFGIIAALYLREYSNQGVFVRFVRIAVNNLAGVPSIVFGVFGLGFFIYFVGGSIDQLFYPEKLPTPTWGTGGILWASLTLALLTVPVVIVSTEEALASIPRGIKEAALALGSTKWQMIRKIVLPASAPGILTGVILAMARGAGEVAPLMITGVVKLAPSLPLDWNFPFFHLDRKFMHLGFHIYDVGFQSPNVESALPMVYMTTFLLIAIVVLLNITAMVLRKRLLEKYKTSTF